MANGAQKPKRRRDDEILDWLTNGDEADIPSNPSNQLIVYILRGLVRDVKSLQDQLNTKGKESKLPTSSWIVYLVVVAFILAFATMFIMAGGNLKDLPLKTQ